MKPSKRITPEQIDAAIARTEWIERLTAAREAVVEAAKEWAGNHSLSSTIRANLADALRDAVARLLEVESEHG